MSKYRNPHSCVMVCVHLRKAGNMEQLADFSHGCPSSVHTLSGVNTANNGNHLNLKVLNFHTSSGIDKML